MATYFARLERAFIMSNIFFRSDDHFGHEATFTKFKRADGSPLRIFDDVAHMNEYMVMQHNRVVGPKDKTYFLGDLAMHKRYLPIIHRMNGEKVLIRGNHDEENASVYLNYFKDVRGSHQFDGMLFTHIPVHPSCLYRWKVNVHGHLHANNILLPDGSIDDRYYSVCVEQLEDYTPISLEALKEKLKFVLEREVKI